MWLWILSNDHILVKQFCPNFVTGRSILRSSNQYNLPMPPD
uniref:Uncharacterized protein n=1 Tax=Arundo donax TaxID=35708 RepID=A0A0A9EK09_ARUDO